MLLSMMAAGMLAKPDSLFSFSINIFSAARFQPGEWGVVGWRGGGAQQNRDTLSAVVTQLTQDLERRN